MTCLTMAAGDALVLFNKAEFENLKSQIVISSWGGHKELAAKLTELERKLTDHDGHLQTLFEAIRQLIEPPEGEGRKIGF